MKVWKLCRRWQPWDPPYSAFAEAQSLDYGIGMKTSPRSGDGPLAAFESLEMAWDFKKGMSIEVFHSLPIFEAEAELSLETRLWCWKPNQVTHLPERRNMDLALPLGTVFCDSITLIKEVE